MTASELVARLVDLNRPDFPVEVVIEFPLRTIRLGIVGVEIDTRRLILGPIETIEILVEAVDA